MLRAEWPEQGGEANGRDAVASGSKYVEKLSEEFNKRAPMFQDDVLFIRCAPGARSGSGSGFRAQDVTGLRM